MSSFTKNMTVSGGPKIAVTPVTGTLSSKTAISAAADAIDTFKNPPGVRDGARQTMLSSKQGADTSIKTLILNADRATTVSE